MHSTVNILRDTGLRTSKWLKWWISCCVNFISIQSSKKHKPTTILSFLPLKAEASLLEMGLGARVSSALPSSHAWPPRSFCRNPGLWGASLKSTALNFLLKMAFPSLVYPKAWVAFCQKQLPRIAGTVRCSNTCPIFPALPGTGDSHCSLPGTQLLTRSGARFPYHPRPPWKASHEDVGEAARSARQMTSQPWILSGARCTHLDTPRSHIRYVWGWLRTHAALVRNVQLVWRADQRRPTVSLHVLTWFLFTVTDLLSTSLLHVPGFMENTVLLSWTQFHLLLMSFCWIRAAAWIEAAWGPRSHRRCHEEEAHDAISHFFPSATFSTGHTPPSFLFLTSSFVF